MRTRKSSSGDSTAINPYMLKWIGHEVTTWEIIMTKNGVTTKIKKKVL